MIKLRCALEKLNSTSRMGVVPKLEHRLDIESVSDEDEALTRLHYILYGNSGSSSSRKRQICLWRPGSSESRIKKSQIKAALEESLGTVLKEICVMLKIDIGATRLDNEQNILRALIEAPVVEKRKPKIVVAPPPVIRKSPGRRKGGKNDPKYAAEYAAGTRRRPGRPRILNDSSALHEFLKRNYPQIFREWENLETWVKEKYDVSFEQQSSDRFTSEEREEVKENEPERREPSPKKISSVSRPKSVKESLVKPPIVKRGRGRPRKVPSVPEKRGRGRPRKTAPPAPSEVAMVKRGPGRPRKYL